MQRFEYGGGAIFEIRSHRLAIMYLRKGWSAPRGRALRLKATAGGHTLMEFVAKIINGLHGAILISGGIAMLAFALWALTHILRMV